MAGCSASINPTEKGRDAVIDSQLVMRAESVVESEFGLPVTKEAKSEKCRRGLFELEIW